jgi:hypothetical protein
MEFFFRLFLMFFRGLDFSSREAALRSIVAPAVIAALFIGILAIIAAASAAGS